MLHPDLPALVLAPMEGITDASMRALQGETGAFTYAVSEFLRVSAAPLPTKVFYRHVPELLTGARTENGLPVHVQLLGGDPERMAQSAVAAVAAGAEAIDLNFGCPAPTVNRHDGGASLLREPERIREIVRSVRDATPSNIPVSAKLRLGWDCTDAIHANAAMAAEGGAAWITIHARTRMQGYLPPVHWALIGRVREQIEVPVIANGDIWSYEDFRRCRDETGCRHFMIGRGALADPGLPHQIARDLGTGGWSPIRDWRQNFLRLAELVGDEENQPNGTALMRLKQWMKLAHSRGTFPHFDVLKQTRTLREFFDLMEFQEGSLVRLAELVEANEAKAAALA